MQFYQCVVHNNARARVYTSIKLKSHVKIINDTKKDNHNQILDTFDDLKQKDEQGQGKAHQEYGEKGLDYAKRAKITKLFPGAYYQAPTILTPQSVSALAEQIWTSSPVCRPLKGFPPAGK